MRIVYLDADFASATGETGLRSYAFAQGLIARGHEVMMLTSDRQLKPPANTNQASGPTAGQTIGQTVGRTWRTQVDGVPVTVVNVGLSWSGSRLARIWHHILFAWMATAYLLRCPAPDVLYVTSPPISAMIPALLLRWRRKVPFVLEVREVWPEVAHAMGLIRSRILIFLLRQLALLAYRSAACVVALTKATMNHIKADIPLTPPVTLIGACCDLERFGNVDGTTLRQQKGWADKFVCLHVGPMIRSTGLEAIMRVADVLREDEQFVFWLVGDGDQRAELERNVRDRELRNVFLQDNVPRAQLPEILAAADLCLLTVRHCRVLEQSSGDRLFDYLAAGKPVLLNYSGWQRELLETNKAGRGATLGRYGEFFEQVCKFCDKPERRKRMGINARRLAETAYHPDLWISRLEEVLQTAATTLRAV